MKMLGKSNVTLSHCQPFLPGMYLKWFRTSSSLSKFTRTVKNVMRSRVVFSKVGEIWQVFRSDLSSSYSNVELVHIVSVRTYLSSHGGR